MHILGDKHGDSTWQDITSANFNNLVDHKRDFPEPDNLHKCPALGLDAVAAVSARKAMQKYNGVRIDCEYLGVLADDRVASLGVLAYKYEADLGGPYRIFLPNLIFTFASPAPFQVLL